MILVDILSNDNGQFAVNNETGNYLTHDVLEKRPFVAPAFTVSSNERQTVHSSILIVFSLILFTFSLSLPE